jgi:cellulose synthase/poly-beta-1,6-N-acetylglucosamine synthase-like glycosyltransferase
VNSWLSHTDLILLAALAVVALYQCYFYLHYLLGVNRWVRKQRSLEPVEESHLPKVSVIVCARNEQHNLQTYLHALLRQDYPAYEVIVVNDGSQDDTQQVLEQYALQHPNLYLTFVPCDARVMSSKKLALTIGIKAARYEHVLLTDADCRPESRFWIRSMMQAFVQGGEDIEVVLGFGAYFEQKTVLSSLISYDTLFNGLQYLGMAAAKHPYMGVGRNLAYKKGTFFRNEGFRGFLNERSGDDDLFVNKVATGQNTAIVCSPESITWSPPKTTWYEWLHQKRRHLSVSNHYKTGSKMRLTIEPLSRAFFYLLLIAIALMGGGMAIGIAYALWWLRLVMQLSVINISAHRLGVRLFGIEIVVYDIVLPLITLWILFSQRFRKQPIYW